MDRVSYEILELIYALQRQKRIIVSIGMLFLVSFLVSYLLILNIPWIRNFGEEILLALFTSLNLKNIGSMGASEVFLLIVEHNLLVNLLNYILNIFSTFVVMLNAFILAYVLSVIGPLKFILLIGPHGIVEIPALILGSSAGVVLFTSLVYRLKGDRLKASLQFFDSLRLFLLSMVLFTVAAFIESFITFGIKSLLL